MAQDFVLHGDFVQFTGNARCKACQGKDLKCALQHSDEGCMACAGAGRDCIFSRYLEISGPKARFDWLALLHAARGQEIIPLRTPATSIATPATTPFLGEIIESRPPLQAIAPRPRNEIVSVPMASVQNANPERIRARSDSSPEVEGLRRGIHPRNRIESAEIPTIAEQERERDHAKRNALVTHWLDAISLESPEEDQSQAPPDSESPSTLRWSHPLDPRHIRPDNHEAGPPDVDHSEAMDSESKMRVGSENPQPPRSPSDMFLPRSSRGPVTNQSPNLEAFPWIEPLRLPSLENTIAQPGTSNQAMFRFERRAHDMDTASHLANESDSSGPRDERISAFLRQNSRAVPRPSHDIPKKEPSATEKGQMTVERTSSENALADRILAISQGGDEAENLLPKLQNPDSSSNIMSHSAPTTAIVTSKRIPSLRSSLAEIDNKPFPNPLSATKPIIPRHLEQRDAPRPAMNFDRVPPLTTELGRVACRNDIVSFNPRMPEYLLERMTQEQLRRHERLTQLKSNHAKMRQQGRCPSGSHCFDPKDYSRWFEAAQHATLSGLKTVGSKYLPDDPDRQVTGATYQHGRAYEQEDLDDEADEIFVGSSTLPSGYPVPPEQSFPADFECPFCFRLKRFQKPSDWVKHIHEDIQPFVCTFKDCWEPRSFKRKADWVRHENERHRQLEWWTCNLRDCSHKCFRKDNFVQHLVREHKMPEPKSRGHEHRSGAAETPDDQLWKLVETCRHETSKSPKDEPCKFCGNVCNSWKKLTVHVAKHMENIAIPVWTRVAPYDSMPKPTNSPIEQKLPPPPTPRPILASFFPVNAPNGSNPLSTEGPFPGKLPLALAGRASSVPSTASQITTGSRLYQCEVAGCAHERGFATQTDLNRHQKGVHGIYQSNDSISYRCVGKDCNNADKIWPRRDNFRGHLSRMHPNENIEELTERYVALLDTPQHLLGRDSFLATCVELVLPVLSIGCVFPQI